LLAKSPVVYYICLKQTPMLKKKRKTLFLGAVMMLLCISMRAQTLSPMVLSSSGGYFAVGSTTLSVTVAEMTMVQTFTQPSGILTQGFQQSEPLTTFVQENIVAEGDVIIYPNPSNGFITVNYYAASDAITYIKIYNMVGQEVFNREYASISGANVISLDLHQYSQGIYLLGLTTVYANGIKNSAIQKINLTY
jgi:hypothetical protein